MEFEKLSFKHKKFIDEKLKNIESYSSDFSITSLLLWENFNPLICVEDNIIFIKGIYNGEEVFISPLCSNENYLLAIQKIEEYTLKNNIALKIILVQDFQRILFDENYIMYKDERLTEYIYSTRDLIELQGKKFHSKRNHIKSFFDIYKNNYQFRDYEYSDFNLVMNFLENWGNEKDWNYQNEQQKFIDILENRKLFNVEIYLLIINEFREINDEKISKNKLIGITIFEKTANGIGVVVFEKCRADIVPQSYTVINNLSAIKLKDCNVINRQEDMGIAGLIKVKQSYHPITLLDKYVVLQNRDKELKKLYQEGFDDSDRFVEFFFEKIYTSDNAIYEMYEGKIAAALFIRKKHLRIGKIIIEIPYVAGVVTKKDLRYMGFARKLLSKTLIHLKNLGELFVMLYPFKHSFYEQFGWATFNYTSCFNSIESLTNEDISKDNLMLDLTQINGDYQIEIEDASFNHLTLLADIYNSFAAEYNIAQYRTAADMHLRMEEVFSDNGSIYLININGNSVGYFICCTDKIEEFIIPKAFFMIARNSIPMLKKKQILYPLDKKKEQPYEMLRVLDAERILNMLLPINTQIEQRDTFVINIKDDILGDTSYIYKNGKFVKNFYKTEYDYEMTVLQLASAFAGDYTDFNLFSKGDENNEENGSGTFFLDTF